MITGDQLNISLDSFSKTISCYQIGLVYHNIDPKAIATDCISNVLKFKETYGGDIRFGWTFGYRTNDKYGDYLVATHHAVWHAPDGSLIDITPFHIDAKHHPITENGSVLFLLDDLAQPIKHERFIIPRPLRFFPIQKDKSLDEYIETLNKKETADYKKEFGINIEGLE